MTMTGATGNNHRWIRRRSAAGARTRLWLVVASLLGLLPVVAARLVLPAWRAGVGGVAGAGGQDVEIVGARARRDTVGVLGGKPQGVALTADNNNKNCTPRSVNNFPGNFFTLAETQDGGVFIHILISLYLFAALGIVCDDYFVPALERICEDLGLQEDVAGATFMAAGSSAPELCTSIVGVFIAKSDVGVGTIVGSAVFNILVIVGLCGLFTATVVELTWYPLMRDAVFYLISVLTLVLVIMDSEVYWYEAMSMLLLYGVYIVLMYFNRRLERRALSSLAAFRLRYGQGSVMHFSHREDEERQHLLEDSVASNSSAATLTVEPKIEGEEETGFNDTGDSGKSFEDEEEEYESPWEIPERFLPRVHWVAMVPTKAICYLSIPDCRKGGVWRRLYPLTFIMAVVWISVFTYVMVWMITITGDALGIPDTVMGLTLLAAGTSLPDCLASVLVARDGFGDMAVSNSIGSNVFDILLCLGLPWLIDTAIVSSGEHLQINSSGLLYSSVTLLTTVVFLLVAVAINKWRLTKAFGGVCLFTYVAVITLSSLFELNVFGDLNPLLAHGDVRVD